MPAHERTFFREEIVNASPARQSLLAALRRRRRHPAAWLALCAYLVVGAVVPPGHMAAALASGTAFHLCPGDLRSAQILHALAPGVAAHPHATLQPSSSYDSAPAHHHGTALHPGAGPHGSNAAVPAADAGSDAAGHGQHAVLADALDNDAADTGCTLASGASAAVSAPATLPDEPALLAAFSASSRRLSSLPARWLRPPVRSPPL